MTTIASTWIFRRAYVISVDVPNLSLTSTSRSPNCPKAGGMRRSPNVGASEEGSVELPISRGNGSTGRPTTRARAMMTTAWCLTGKRDGAVDGDPTAAARDAVRSAVRGEKADGIASDPTAEAQGDHTETDGGEKGIDGDIACNIIRHSISMYSRERDPWMPTSPQRIPPTESAGSARDTGMASQESESQTVSVA